MKYKIEHNITIPKTHRTGQFQALAQQMKIGDSVLLDSAEAMTLRITLQRQGFKMVQRKEKNNVVRCWKVANELKH